MARRTGRPTRRGGPSHRRDGPRRRPPHRRAAGTARDYAAVVAQGAEPELEPVDLAAILEHELDRHRALYLDATYEVDGDLPEVVVLATPMLQSVFTNLLHNAVQYNDREEPRVVVGYEVADDAATVTVADDGPGLPTEDWTALVDSGERTLEDEDASLGLYLVDRLVTAYEGSVAVAENEPRGTVVHGELPLAAA